MTNLETMMSPLIHNIADFVHGAFLVFGVYYLYLVVVSRKKNKKK